MNFFGNKTSGTTKKSTIRTVQVPVKASSNGAKFASVSASPGNGSRPSAAPVNRFQLSQRHGAPKVAKTIRQPSKTVERRALASGRGVKRKSATPDVVFSDEEEDDSSDVGASESDTSRKRVKSSVSSVESLGGPQRDIASKKAFAKEGKPLRFLHGADATSGEHARKFVVPWGGSDVHTVELQYPSRSKKERFELVWPKGDDYKPMEDLLATIETISTYYLPDELSAECLDDTDGFPRRLNRAWKKEDIQEWVKIIEEFNEMLERLVDDGTIERELSKCRSMHIDWIKRILEQIFWRTVSPKAEMLNQYKMGSDNVYGELLPKFVTDIIKQTNLNREQTFIDLGSGVGNVVLQAALEVGCESWGIEMMKNPCDLAELQAKEFSARSQLWGLNVGSVNLLRGDMTSHPDVPKLLQRADVVLVNNQAFTPELNDKLLTMFLDLKPGAQVVSLKPFVPEGHKMAQRNVDSIVNQFVQRSLTYYSGYVSWSYGGNAHWYIATKDLRPLNAFRGKMGLDRL